MKKPKTIASRGTVLIVDEDLDAIATYRSTLSDAGFLVESAADGREALGVVEDGPPDVIVSEMALPNASGLYLLTGIRTRPATMPIPFIAATKIPRDSEIWTEIDPMWNVYLPKPVDPDELIATIDQLLSRTVTIDELPPLIIDPPDVITLIEEQTADTAMAQSPAIKKPAARRAPKKKQVPAE